MLRVVVIGIVRMSSVVASARIVRKCPFRCLASGFRTGGFPLFQEVEDRSLAHGASRSRGGSGGRQSRFGLHLKEQIALLPDWLLGLLFSGFGRTDILESTGG